VVAGRAGRPESIGRAARASTRLAVVAVVGLIAAAVTGGLVGWDYAPAIGWDVAASLFLASTWTAIVKMNAEQTKSHATREDPSKGTTRGLLLAASLASLLGVGYLLAQASGDNGATRWLTAGLGVFSVAISWLVVHTLFTLNYAFRYYTENAGGVDFNQKEPPQYTDFAYLAFTIGMTFQVSDTDLTTRGIRATALRHALLSYLFGALILGASVNLVASLASTASR
jgi:uncharacterized membrane protein